MRARLLPALALLLALPLGCTPSDSPPQEGTAPSRLRQPRAADDPASSGSGGTAAEDPAKGSDPTYPGPLAAYGLTVTEQATIDHAEDVLLDRCMRRFGFSYPVPPFSELLAAARAGEAELISRLYGPNDRETARRYGYLIKVSTAAEREADSPEGSDDPNWLFVADGTRNLEDNIDPTRTDGESPGEVDGVAVPYGGCFGEVRRSLGPELFHMNGGVLANKYQILAAEDAWTRPAFRAVAADWASCMRKAGWKASDPLKPADGDDVRRLVVRVNEDDPPSEEEVRLALADIDCKEATDLVSRLQKIVDDVELEYLEKHQLELQENRKRFDEIVETATKVVEQAGGN
ncbi:MAG: hypothetical protein QM713_02975 [Arachnia sp.]